MKRNENQKARKHDDWNSKTLLSQHYLYPLFFVQTSSQGLGTQAIPLHSLSALIPKPIASPRGLSSQAAHCNTRPWGVRSAYTSSHGGNVFSHLLDFHCKTSFRSLGLASSFLVPMLAPPRYFLFTSRKINDSLSVVQN